MSTQLDPLSLSGDLLYAVKTEGDIDRLREQLATLGRAHLERALSTREGKLSFWLNCYNAYIQLRLEESPDALEGGRLDRWKFFVRDRVPVAETWLSLNDIEHGLLRSSKHPWGLGYLPRLFPSRFERRFRLEECDPRIHFALNRGPEDSPPIAVYSPADVDAELDIAVEWFLEKNVEYDPEEDVAAIPRRFRWYQGDFGGRNGIVAFLEEYSAIPEGSRPVLAYEASDRAPEFEMDAEFDELRP